MPKITLPAIQQLVDHSLDEKLEPINTILARHTEILNNHTEALMKLLNRKKTMDEGKAVHTFRVDRLENWAKLAGKKIGLEPEF